MLILASHTTTHMDALSHVYADDTMYNGFPAASFTTHGGASRCDIRQTGSFAGRGVLLDLPRHQGLDWLEPGHAISCRRAGRLRRRPGQPSPPRRHPPGAHRLARPVRPARGDDDRRPASASTPSTFIADHDVVAVGADNSGVEVLPWDGDIALNVHIELLVKRGVTLMEHLVLSELAADGCHEFLLCVGALPVTGAAGSPINPIAIG